MCHGILCHILILNLSSKIKALSILVVIISMHGLLIKKIEVEEILRCTSHQLDIQKNYKIPIKTDRNASYRPPVKVK
jgi:hypothetical protein